MKVSFPKPDKFTTTIDATTEVALERAMFSRLISRGNEKDKIEWLDMELPLDIKRENRLDLIGRLQKKKRFIICEVKYGDMLSTSNKPYEAANEVVRYFAKILENKQYLSECHHAEKNEDGLCGKPFNWEDINMKNTELIVVANAAYWAYWIAHRGMDVPKTGEYEGFSHAVKCYSIDIPKNYFELQKASFEAQEGDASKYRPFISFEVRIDPLEYKKQNGATADAEACENNS